MESEVESKSTQHKSRVRQTYKLTIEMNSLLATFELMSLYSCFLFFFFSFFFTLKSKNKKEKGKQREGTQGKPN